MSGDEPVRIDRSRFAERYRYGCPPARHTDWEKTNGQIYCPGCARRGLDDSHDAIVDLVTGERIAVCRVILE